MQPQSCVLLKYGELTLKRGNRRRFRVATHAALDRLLPVEARAGVDTLVEDALERVQQFDLGPAADLYPTR
ncbi:hypothetical protein OQ968_11215 [Mycobacterium sp. 663a-19]|uniref:hypothetical protein n=1 Tax=Mycobacterium sp. 663a-19 TaxID=2986148 RepID=UPI002D1F616A|nr:hypothetical protein [Mycobacterium sp. 663a-19]MEB3981834.1 hypothetical protein [Mycobacterium sp. 663a-19]